MDIIEKIEKFLYESMLSYWLSPKNDMVSIDDTHISLVIKHPEKFGLTREYIESIFAKHGERLGQEGKAREELIKFLIDHNWARLRRYKDYWSINVKVLNAKMRKLLAEFAFDMINTKKEKDKYIDVIITCLEGPPLRTTMYDLAKNMNENNQQTKLLRYCKIEEIIL